MGSVLGIAAVLAAASFVILLYMGRAYWSWVVPGAILLAASAVAGPASPMLLAYSAGVFGLLAVIFGVPAVRRATVTRPLFKIVGRMLPSMSETERVALDAGTVWWDGELFSGKPDWSKLLDFKVQELSAEERAFLAGPVEELCQMLDDWRVRQEGDMPPEVWEFMKTRKLFGMIIPKEYGGLGFSAAMHSAVVVKLASRSITAAVTVMVPNSLGPAELLLHYGTDEQKRHNLPRLADGLEIPCFGLTEPEAGSDAGGAKSTGVVCKGTWEGKEVLGMRLNWEKRYITLGPIST
ncbi:MAG: acyl-CoA dehydrogenase family protein, partial [Myxococcales bacterium]|nr:acyl-CoA dehydrogenase family protein [Myxococcales bacterium]